MTLLEDTTDEDCGKRGHSVADRKSPARSMRVSGRRLLVNGVSEIPVGLFGVHAVSLDAAACADWGVEAIRRIYAGPPRTPQESEGWEPLARSLPVFVECFYDRYQPAHVITQPGRWERSLGDLASGYARAARGSGTRFVEFWNEPFLNWVIKPGVNYDPRYYDTSNINPGNPVKIKGAKEFTEHLVWSRAPRIVRDKELSEHYQAAEHCPGDLEIGERFAWNGRKYRKVERWVPKDPTQRHDFAGQQSRIFYERMLRVFAGAIKNEDADIRLIGGWGFHLQRDGWQGWRQLYQPLIENHCDILDGIGEHHYGDDTRIVAAAYETATAFMDRQCGVRLPFFSTEAGGMVNLEDPNDAKPAATGDGAQAALGCMIYTLRDIVHLIDVCPDKAAARFAHQPDINGGDELAFRLLKPLRGDLVFCHGDSTDVWCVAGRREDSVTMVLFNDTTDHRELSLCLDLGRDLDQVDARCLSVGRGGARPSVVEQRTSLRRRNRIAMGPLEALTFVVESWPDRNQAPVTIEQYFAGSILNAVTSTTSLSLPVHLPGHRIRRAAAARVKFAVDRCDTGSVLSLNGRRFPIEPGSRTVRHVVPVADLGETTTLEFQASKSPYEVWMASIELIFD